MIVIVQPIPLDETATPVETTNWIPGFFEEVLGNWEGEPLVRPEQLEYETREELQ